MAYLAAFVVLGLLFALLIGLGLNVRRLTRAAEPPGSGAAPHTEGELAAARLAGRISKAGYRRAMADLAHRAGSSVPAPEVLVPPRTSGDPRAQLNMLRAALPDMPPTILCSAFVLARHGAGIGTLVRRLDLTSWQAATIIAAAGRCPQ